MQHPNPPTLPPIRNLLIVNMQVLDMIPCCILVGGGGNNESSAKIFIEVQG